MNKKKNKIKNIIKLSIIVAILFIVNIIASQYFKRIDLTNDKRYTLTPFTQNFLINMNGSLYIKVYLDGDELPIGFKRMRNEIRQQLREFKVYAKNKLEFEFINPTKNEDKEVRFGIYKQLYNKGLTPVEIKQQTEGQSSNTLIFPSAIVTYSVNVSYQDENGNEKDTTIIKELGVNLLKKDPELPPESEENIFKSIGGLEFEFINAFNKLSKINKPQIAFIEGHGELPEPNLIDINTTLYEYYDVRRGKIDGKHGILDGFKAIIIAKPTKKFTENDKFVIDQYIMNGGKVLWLIDGAIADMDSLINYPVFASLPLELNIQDQLFKYGARINYDLIKDISCAPIQLATGTKNNQAQFQVFNWQYFPVLLSENNHPVTKYLDYLRTEFISSVDTVGLSEDIKRTILLTTSKYSKKMNLPHPISFESINEKPNPSQYNNPNIPIAVLLEGNFESVFLNRQISNYTASPEKFIKNSKKTKMIVVGDGDIIKNELNQKGEPYPLGFDRNAQFTFKGNKEFILNAINYLCDEDGLMTIRTREMKVRLLDKEKIKKQRVLWQSINTLIPIISIVLFGFIIWFIRRRKFVK